MTAVPFATSGGSAEVKKEKDKLDTSVKCESERVKEKAGQKTGRTAPEGP
jgi:hypothetical protein